MSDQMMMDFSGDTLAPDELAPEVRAFIKAQKQAKLEAAIQRKSDYDELTTIVIEKPQRGKPNIWHIWCPRCAFDFERTRVAVAREWAVEHNTKVHDGTLEVVDLTSG